MTAPHPGGRQARPDEIIALRSASFGYADRTVVSGVDLTLHPGEVVALLGANGSGKSTLVKGLLGLNDHLGGSVELFGTPLRRFRRRSLLGYVPQRHTLSGTVAATVTEIVAAGRLPHQGLLARPSREDRRIIGESLELVGLADRARDDVAELSGGQQRRVLIARALAGRPEVLVMDEPTAGVDLGNQRALEAVLARLAERGTTMLVVTHEVAPLRSILTRVVTMSGGRITFDGPASRLDVAGDVTGDWVGPGARGGHDGHAHRHGQRGGPEHTTHHDGHHHDDGRHDDAGTSTSLGLTHPGTRDRRTHDA
ncbi:metal ABC transporter ATP-binding protein [Agilicoccus flavus]|uniref:metal ABC transporter ATP-binding protein n=1 Tax=Agilicoccus flavus TaxID=2775968 RepID=UPI001CF6AC57|nr:metal ABC transporter ATP-binding protein [Agilicoccus flavus]